MENTKQGQPVVETNTDTAASTAATESSDQWSDAQEAFEEVEETTPAESKSPEQTQTKQDDQPQSHIEQEDKTQTNDLDKALETLPVPHKYKGKVKEFLQNQITSREQEVEKVQQNLGAHQEAVKSMVDVFRDIAHNPQRLAEYVVQYGRDLGIDDQTISRFVSNGQQPIRNQPEQAPVKIDDIINKHVEQITTATDANGFVSGLKGMVLDAVNANKQEMINMFKQVLSAYHNIIIDPNIKTIEADKESRVKDGNANTWRRVKSGFEKKFQDFGKYETAITEKLTKDPVFLPMVRALNANPEACKAQGLTHESLIEKAYYLVTRNDHLEQANTRQNWQGGLPPNAKHVTTSKSVSGGWDDVQREVYPESLS